MRNTERTKEQLISELEALKRKVAKAKNVEKKIIESEEKCLNAGANEYIKKPLSLKDLIQNINNLLKSN